SHSHFWASSGWKSSSPSVFSDMPTSASFKNSCSSMSLATMSSLDGGSSVAGSATAALTSVPQPGPVQPPRRSHPTMVMTATSRDETGKRRSMALKISPRGERCNGGRRDGLPPIRDNRCRDFLECGDPPEHRGERRFCRRGAEMQLRSSPQNRPVLQERVAAAHLRRADEFAPARENLPAHRSGKTGGGAARPRDSPREHRGGTPRT